MVWPFGRKKDPAPRGPRPEAPRAADADANVTALIVAWLAEHGDGHHARPGPEPNTLHVGHAPQAPAGAVLKVRRGKLAAIDLHDPTLRPLLNRLITRLDEDQLWSFNGVVATKYEESPPP